MSQTFDVQYPSNPWAGIDRNQRTFYDPALMQLWTTQAMYAKFVTAQYNLFDVRAPSMVITSLVPPHGNSDALGVRQLWLPSSWIDSAQRTINFSRYGSKLAYHKYDDLITYWKLEGQAGLLRIINSGIGGQMMEINDKLARNAYLAGAINGGFALYGTASGTKFNTIQSADVLDTEKLDDIHLGMAERGVPYASNPNGEYGNIVCITTPGALRDLRNEATALGNEFINSMLYKGATNLINNEIGTYHNVRFVQTPRAILYNCGDITFQAQLKSSTPAGSGAPSAVVDGTFTVGQAGAQKYLQLGSGQATNFAENDILTIHEDRTSAYGITNGVDFTDGKLHNRRVISVDTGTDRITLDLPLMEDFIVDLGGTVYGYVTKGRHVHTATFIGGSDGVVLGVSQPPRIHTPPPVDDFDSMQRVSWDSYLKFQAFETKVFEVAFLSGSNRVKGARVAP